MGENLNNALKVLEDRLKDLRHKMQSATTAREKLIYSEAVVHCIDDIRRYHKKRKFSIIQKIIAGVFFIVLIGLVLSLVSMLKTESVGSSTIGHAVTENAN